MTLDSYRSRKSTPFSIQNKAVKTLWHLAVRPRSPQQPKTTTRPWTNAREKITPEGSTHSRIAGYQFIKSCTWWQVFEIWYGDTYGYEVSKNHRKQNGVSLWWSHFEQSNMATIGAQKSHISANFITRIKCTTTFSMFLDLTSLAIVWKKTEVLCIIYWTKSIKLMTDTTSCWEMYTYTSWH